MINRRSKRIAIELSKIIPGGDWVTVPIDRDDDRKLILQHRFEWYTIWEEAGEDFVRFQVRSSSEHGFDRTQSNKVLNELIDMGWTATILSTGPKSDQYKLTR